MNINEYWSGVSDSGADHIAYPLWRAYCDALHTRLLNRWLKGARFHATLKTDLFDEAHGKGMAKALSAISNETTGIDGSASIIRRALDNHPGLKATIADIRHLPFERGRFDFVFSNSSLDHFESDGDIARSLHEIHRVLAPGGTLLLTLDNPRNPAVGLRNMLPSSLFGRSPLLPYFVGPTLALSPLVQMLEGVGFTVQEKSHIMHVPRIIFLHLCRFFSPQSSAGRALLRFMLAHESLAHLPTSPMTGHFAAVMAHKII